MAKKSVLKVACTYNGYSVARSGVTTVRFKAPYGEIASYVQLLQMIGLDTKFYVKNDESKFNRVGVVRLKNLNINKEGDAVIVVYGESLDLDITSLIDRVIKIGFELPNELGGEADE